MGLCRLWLHRSSPQQVPRKSASTSCLSNNSLMDRSPFNTTCNPIHHAKSHILIHRTARGTRSSESPTNIRSVLTTTHQHPIHTSTLRPSTHHDGGTKASAGSRQMLQEGLRRRRRIRVHLREDRAIYQCSAEGEAGGQPQTRDQEAPEATRSDQNMGCQQRHQRQGASVREPEIN